MFKLAQAQLIPAIIRAVTAGPSPSQKIQLAQMLVGAGLGGVYGKYVAPRALHYQDAPGAGTMGAILNGAMLGAGLKGMNTTNAAARLKLLLGGHVAEQMGVQGLANSELGRLSLREQIAAGRASAAADARIAKETTAAQQAAAAAAKLQAEAAEAQARAATTQATATADSTIGAQLTRALGTPQARGAGVGLGLAAGAGALHGAFGRDRAEDDVGGQSRTSRGLRTAGRLAGPLALLGAVAAPYLTKRP